MSADCVTHLFDNIPFDLDFLALMKRVRVKEGSANAEELSKIAAQACEIARPKAFYQVAYVTGRGEDYVEIESLRFDSRVMSVNFQNAFRVFPFLATCGQELQAFGDSREDLVHQFWVEIIKEMAVRAALNTVTAHILEQYQPGETSAMNPGSLADWPIQQQRVLFDLFGNYREKIGVRLTDSMLMIPTKSVSGIRFPTGETHFESCQLCPREDCPGRRAPYEPALFEEKYGLDQH